MVCITHANGINSKWWSAMTCPVCSGEEEHYDTDRYADYFKCYDCGRKRGIPHQSFGNDY